MSNKARPGNTLSFFSGKILITLFLSRVVFIVPCCDGSDQCLWDRVLIYNNSRGNIKVNSKRSNLHRNVHYQETHYQFDLLKLSRIEPALMSIVCALAMVTRRLFDPLISNYKLCSLTMILIES